MRIGMIILCLLGFFGASGQRYSNLNVFEGDGGDDQSDILVDGENYYTINLVNGDSLFCNKTFIAAVQEDNRASLILSKFGNNGVEKHIHFESEFTFGRLFLVNDKIWLCGYRYEDLKVDGQLIYPSVPKVDDERYDRGSGFIFIYDKDLNLEKKILMGSYEHIKAVAFKNEKYYIAGDFGFFSDTITFGGLTLSKSNSVAKDTREMFLFIVNPDSFQSEQGLYFGGGGTESLERMHVDDYENITILGSTDFGNFTIGEHSYFTSSHPARASLFLFKMNSQGMPIFYNYCDGGEFYSAVANRSSDLTIDNDGNIYIGSISGLPNFELNNQLLYESLEGALPIVFMCFDPTGELKWFNHFDGGVSIANNYRLSNIMDDKITFGGYSMTSVISKDGVVLQPNDSLELSGLITLDKETGKFIGFQEIVKNLSARVHNIVPMENGNYMVYLRIWYRDTSPIDSFFREHNKQRTSLFFEFNPEIPQIVSTLDAETTNSFTEINIFPNPIQKESKLSIQANEPIKTIELYDINGRLIERISSVDETMTIDTNHSPGTYIMKFQMETQGSVYKKLIIQ